MKKIDSIAKRLDTLQKTAKAPEKASSNTQYNGGCRG
jgi:hypothetical protein